jgi:hypothetical protein
MKIDWPNVRHNLSLGWFYVRSHLTKALGVVAVGIGYALENQAQFVALLSASRRGQVLKFFGVATFALGLYNQFFKPVKPVPPTMEPVTDPTPAPPGATS